MQQKKLTQIFNKNKNILKELIYIFLISFSAIFVTYYYGYIGVFPIDSFLIYDAGYKILNGFHPFKDYWTITGPLLDYIQFIFFKFLGINWLSYVLHAASINLLLTLSLYYFFAKLGLNKFYCFIYSLSCSILAYPSIGTPFVDHHAVIFSLISVLFIILAIKHDFKSFWFLTSLFLFLSFFSKQIPSAYLMILFTFIIGTIFYLNNFKNLRNLIYVIYGGVLPSILLIIFFNINDILIKDFFIQYFLYPMGIGEQRKLNIIFTFNKIFSQFKFIYFSLIPLIFVIFKLKKKLRKKLEVKKDLVIIFAILFSVSIFLYTQMITKNQILIFFVIPFILGTSHYFYNKYINESKKLQFFVLFILIISTIKFHIRFNENKKFMELNNVDLNLAVDAKVLDESLNNLQWISPKYSKNPKRELDQLSQLKKIILLDGEKKIILSNYQLLPAITGTKTITPNKWFDDLSVPDKNNKYFNYYKYFFINKLKEQNIKNIYITENKINYITNVFGKECLQVKILNELARKVNILSCLK